MCELRNLSSAHAEVVLPVACYNTSSEAGLLPKDEKPETTVKSEEVATAGKVRLDEP